jgi:hypothetical protein
MGLEKKCKCGCCSDFDPFTEVDNDVGSKKLNKEVDLVLKEEPDSDYSYEKKQNTSNKFYSFFKSIVDYFKS